ncbi:MAG: hypothetical protein WCJ39_02720 [bacterium]
MPKRSKQQAISTIPDYTTVGKIAKNRLAGYSYPRKYCRVESYACKEDLCSNLRCLRMDLRSLSSFSDFIALRLHVLLQADSIDADIFSTLQESLDAMPLEHINEELTAILSDYKDRIHGYLHPHSSLVQSDFRDLLVNVEEHENFPDAKWAGNFYGDNRKYPDYE